MSLHASTIDSIAAPRREVARRQPARPRAGVASPRQPVALMKRWRAVLRKLHEINCLPELGGCAEELIDTRISSEGAVAERR